MADEATIRNLLANGKEVYSVLVEEWSRRFDIGIDICHDRIKNLQEIIMALEYQLAEGLITDKTTQELYKCLAREVGYIPISGTSVYFGYLDVSAVLTPSQIEASTNKVTIATGLEYTLNLDLSPTLKYVWIAESTAEPLKLQWKDVVFTLNTGNIGTAEDLFGLPATSGGYRFYITEYKTIFTNPIKFIK